MRLVIAVLVQRIFVPADRVIALGIYCRYCILQSKTLNNSFSEVTMLANPQPPRIHLPKGWQDCVQSTVLHAIALAHYAIVYARAWAADSINARVRLAAENERVSWSTESFGSASVL